MKSDINDYIYKEKFNPRYIRFKKEMQTPMRFSSLKLNKDQTVSWEIIF